MECNSLSLLYSWLVEVINKEVNIIILFQFLTEEVKLPFGTTSSWPAIWMEVSVHRGTNKAYALSHQFSFV
jgi:hypothetical protein